MRVSKTLILRITVGTVGLILAVMAALGTISIEAVSIAIIAISAYIAFAVRKNRLLLLIALVMLYTHYSIGVANYLNHVDSIATTYAYTEYAYHAMHSLLVFLSILSLLLPVNIKKFGFGDGLFSRKQSNPALVVLVSIYLIVILTIQFMQPKVDIGNRLGFAGDVGILGQLYEYSIIFFIVGFILSGKSLWCKNLLTIIAIAFAVNTMLAGSRVSVLQMLLVVFFFRASEHMTWKSIVPILLACLFVNLSIGVFRMAFLSTDLHIITDKFVNMLTGGLPWDTAYFAWHASITFYAYDSLTNSANNMYLFGQWLLSIPLGTSAVTDSSLPSVTRQYFTHYSGGILPAYFDFYLGTIGVIAIGVGVTFVFRLINNMQTWTEYRLSLAPYIAKSCCIWLTVTVFRWYIYSPSQLTRGLILCAIVSFGLLWIDKAMTTNRTRKLTSGMF
jgi:hypothetical protein